MTILPLLLGAALLASVAQSAEESIQRAECQSNAEQKARAFAAGFKQFLADERAGRVPRRRRSQRAPLHPEIEYESKLDLLQTIAYRGYPGTVAACNTIHSWLLFCTVLYASTVSTV